MTDFDQAFRDAVQPIKAELAEIDAMIAQQEVELTALKASRTRGQKLLAILDPEAAAPKKKRDTNNWHISDEKIEEILGNVRQMNGHGPFSAQDVTNRSGIHVTTVHKALKLLHERGAIRLDHMGGQRNTTKFYALVGGEDV